MPKLLATGYFNSAHLELSLDQQTIVVRLECDSLEKYNQYLERYAGEFLDGINRLFGVHIVSFERLLTKLVS
jgi:hypothetical protein